MSQIIVAVDETNASEKAVSQAASLAERLNTGVTLVHGVQQGTKSEEGSLVQESLDSAENRGSATLEKMERLTNDYNIPVTTELVYGNSPIESVVSYLHTDETNDALGVFIGHRCLSEKEEQYMGSFAKTLIERSPVPVTVVTDNPK